MTSFTKLFWMTLAAWAVSMSLLGAFDNRWIPADENVVRLQVGLQEAKPEVVIVGNSHAYAGVDPALFASGGRACFNLGMPAAGICTVDLIAREVISSPHQRPATVICVLSPLLFHDNSDRFADYPMHRYLPRPLSNLELITRCASWRMIRQAPDLWVASARKGWRKWLSSPEPLDAWMEQARARAGFIPSDTVFSEAGTRRQATLYKDLSRQQLIHETRLNQFLSLMQAIRDAGVAPVLIVPPTHLLGDYLSAGFVKSFRQLTDRLKTEGFVVVDDIVVEGEEFYRDLDHLNARGASEFTRRILARMETLGVWAAR